MKMHLVPALRVLRGSPRVVRNYARRISSVSEVELKPAKETQDVHVLDRLLSIVRQRSDPAFRSAVPMRSPLLWKENLSNRPSTVSPTPILPASTAPNLDPRNMHDSYTHVLLPFASSPQLLEEYTNASGGIRTGKLMEHLDSLAGSIAYKHVLGPAIDLQGGIQETGFYLVTAAVDRLDMLKPLTPENITDVRLSGHVIFVGKSSIEVAVKMEGYSVVDGKEVDETYMIGRFSMVCRDAHTHKARQVNPLIVSTPEEKTLFSMGEKNKLRKKLISERSLSRVPPSAAESELLHSLFLKHRTQGSESPLTTKEKEPEAVYMRDTKLESTLMMHPQERNVHQKVFGGYLMRLAYEIGYVNASHFIRGPLRFISLDRTIFKLPVSIGSVLRLTSVVAHTSSDKQFGTLVNIHVRANVVDMASGDEQTTNDFHFTWGREDGGVPLKRTVVPITYPEAMEWLEGRRALELGAKIRGLRR